MKVGEEDKVLEQVWVKDEVIEGVLVGVGVRVLVDDKERRNVIDC